jgi:autotransporter-associated beta strand protein
VLHGGVLEFNTLKNGGVASSIGASMGYSQNWIFDGGTYRYTGGTTSTDREARVLSETELNIAKSGTTVTVNNKFEGNGSLVINGEGQLTVGSANFFGYTGATILRGGTLYLSTAEISKAGIGSSSKLVMAGGHLKTKGETENYETYSFPIEVTEETISQFSPNRNCYLRNKLTGAGTLQLNIPYLREYIEFNTTGFTGKLIANGVSSDKNGSLLLLNKGKVNHPTLTIDMKGNARLCAWDTSPTVEIGGISGESGTYIMGSSKNTKNFTCTWKVGYANTNETFNGKINNWSCSGSGYTGTVNITKVGTGDWRLTGANDYKGTTSIAGGRLIVNGTNSGTGQVIVSGGATLAGKGTVAGKVTVMSEATLLAGDTLINAQTLKLTGGCTVNAGGIVEVPLYSNGDAVKCNRIQVTGNFQINDATLRLDLAETEGFKDDASFYIFNIGSATVSGTGFVNIEPARPSATQVWDTSKLLTLGILYVRADEASGVSEIISSDNDNAPVYDLSGRRVANPTKGIYIKNGKKYFMK